MNDPTMPGRRRGAGGGAVATTEAGREEASGGPSPGIRTGSRPDAVSAPENPALVAFLRWGAGRWARPDGHDPLHRPGEPKQRAYTEPETGDQETDPQDPGPARTRAVVAAWLPDRPDLAPPPERPDPGHGGIDAVVGWVTTLLQDSAAAPVACPRCGRNDALVGTLHHLLSDHQATFGEGARWLERCDPDLYALAVHYLVCRDRRRQDGGDRTSGGHLP